MLAQQGFFPIEPSSQLLSHSNLCSSLLVLFLDSIAKLKILLPQPPSAVITGICYLAWLAKLKEMTVPSLLVPLGLLIVYTENAHQSSLPAMLLYLNRFLYINRLYICPYSMLQWSLKEAQLSYSTFSTGVVL